MTVVIAAEGLGKKYLISHQPKERYTALRDVLASRVRRFGSALRHPLRSFSSRETETREEFWALSDVSFEIREGERLGIIGRNGAGKSTLLKILSRITEPSAGRVTISGRVASLLEVGTGFHPELTGRENIFLNGAILGMSRTEIKRKFDEIVDFSGVEKFLDTPVKRYSSGMHVRLAFAVAAHLEPDVLIVDEVLAVGDAAFQRKCLGKMEDVSREGRTLLFVSHNMTAVTSLCDRAVLLAKGRVVDSGSTSSVIDMYMKTTRQQTELNRRADRTGTGRARLIRIHLETTAGATVHAARSMEPIDFVVEIEADEDAVGKQISLVLVVCDRGDNRLCSLYSDWTEGELRLQSRRAVFRCRLPAGLPLVADHYWLTAGILLSGTKADKIDRALEFEVLPAPFFIEGAIPSTTFGAVLVKHNWEQGVAK